MRTEARAVVVGGGVGGCSILYHLAKLGWTDVVLIEQYGLTHGSTWHSAGLVGQLRSTVSLTKMMQYSVGLYADLKDETGKDPGWHELGGLRLASSKPRMEELQRQAGWAKSFGLPVELISAGEAQELFPLMSTDGVEGALFLPQDGYLDPSQLTFALADGARLRGAEIEQRTRVTGITLRNGRVHEVVTDRGTIRTDVVINAGGMYAPQIARMAGVDVPIIPYAHEFLVTEAFDPPLQPLPTLRDPDNLVYWRTEVGGLIMGGYERDPAPWALDGVPDGFEAQLLPEDWERFDELLGNSIRRVPAMEAAEVKKLFNGPEAFTPDGEFILGESDVPGFWVAAGFCAHGLAGAGGMGWQMAEWIVNGEPSLDIWHMDIRRFGRQYRSQDYTLARATEVYATYYDIKYPNYERQAGRPLRLSPAYPRLAELGASFGEKSGWERANWFEPNAVDGDESLRPRGWAGENWSPAIHAEAMATRERAGLFDETSFAKFEVQGPGALGLLQHLCANDVDRPPGSVTYTQMLNRRGGIECDFTVTRLGEDRFRIVTGTAFGNHDMAWVRKHMPDDGSVQLNDVTSAYACFGLWGPRARDILAPLTRSDLSNEAFRYMTAQEISIGSVPCLAVRVTYVGELGWEIYCPAEYGQGLWDVLWQAGREHGMRACGYRAIDALRIEKGYRVWGSDMTPEETPDEAGVSFAVKPDKGDFVGRERLLATRLQAPDRRLCCLVLEDPRSVCLGSEPVRVGGEITGRVTTGGYGFAVGASIAYAYLPASASETGTAVEVEVFGEWIPARVAAEPLWDPAGERIRA
ncbi:MAG TPA: FAD-dependent oxidoreductase [Gaiellales bacterium]|jgi:glycine cleavage system T protein|nr:FAD-dependent oxidoreductase [Gaiellales bacterium]